MFIAAVPSLLSTGRTFLRELKGKHLVKVRGTTEMLVETEKEQW